MYRYFAIAWDSERIPDSNLVRSSLTRLQSGVAQWEAAAEGNGYVVWHTGCDHRRFRAFALGSTGVVLGQLFRKEAVIKPDAEPVALSDGEIRNIVVSKGKHLIGAFWGRYVALLHGPHTSLRVLRDPTGALPCHFSRVGGLVIVFSHFDDYRRAFSFDLRINRRHIAAYLQFDRLVSRATGFLEVENVYAGECLTVNGGHVSHTFHWHPADICRLPAIEDPDRAVELVRQTVENTVHCWASTYHHILHELSGGLDSSIVLSCLGNVRRQPRLTCFNLFTPSSEGDERLFARSAAESVGCDLVEVLHTAEGENLEHLLRPRTLASPVQMGLSSKSEEARARVVRDRSIEAIFSGQGGDHLFQQRGTTLIAAEYVDRHSVRGDIFGMLSDTAALAKTSVWAVGRDVLKYGLFRRKLDPYVDFPFPPFLREPVQDSERLTLINHPWLTSDYRLPAAKVLQVFDLVDCLVFYAPVCDYADVVHPLFSQPIIELCLQLPTYILASGGRDRALLRRAFAERVPRRILTRLSKGGTTSYYHNLVMWNAPFIRDFLLRGSLVADGYLDEGLLRKALAQERLIQGDDLTAVLTALRAEAWLRHCSQVVQQRDAA